MRKWVIIVFTVVVLLGCQAKKEIVEKVSENPEYEKITQQVEEQLDASEKKDKADQDSVSEGQEMIDTTEKILVDYGRLLSGSWTNYPDRVDGERELSWGTVPFASHSYTLIDFIAEQPIFITGPREDGSVGRDSIVAEVKKIEMESQEKFRIYYDNNTSGTVRHRTLAFSYDNENDTISLIDFGGPPFISKTIRYRVSERLPE